MQPQSSTDEVRDPELLDALRTERRGLDAAYRRAVRIDPDHRAELATMREEVWGRIVEQLQFHFASDDVVPNTEQVN